METNKIAPQQRIPGMPCPRCGNFIPTSINELLSANYLRCPTCQLQLNIDRQNSRKALNALEKVEEAQKRMNKLEKAGIRCKLHRL